MGAVFSPVELVMQVMKVNMILVTAVRAGSSRLLEVHRYVLGQLCCCCSRCCSSGLMQQGSVELLVLDVLE